MPGAATRSDISLEDSLRMVMDVVDNVRLDMLQNWLERFPEVSSHLLRMQNIHEEW